MKILVLLLAFLIEYPATKAPIIELKGYFSCRESILMPNENAAFACYAPTQRNCQNGTVIMAYEKRVSQKARFAIIDTVQLTIRYPNNSLSISSCIDAKGKPKQYFVLCKDDALGKKYLRNVLRVWGVNAQGQLVEVPVQTLKCLNDDFGA